uniref:Uncharacterized protein n=1 Tax=Myotis myotis TaxID=51298 RepID=A0A7J7VYM4_MYOMY|nr:hypothetical protein mMyoMyo1_012209 [Myotis myotis]
MPGGAVRACVWHAWRCGKCACACVWRAWGCGGCACAWRACGCGKCACAWRAWGCGGCACAWRAWGCGGCACAWRAWGRGGCAWCAWGCGGWGGCAWRAWGCGRCACACTWRAWGCGERSARCSVPFPRCKCPAAAASRVARSCGCAHFLPLGQVTASPRGYLSACLGKARGPPIRVAQRQVCHVCRWLPSFGQFPPVFAGHYPPFVCGVCFRSGAERKGTLSVSTGPMQVQKDVVRAVRRAVRFL